jgi:hypothetical protein
MTGFLGVVIVSRDHSSICAAIARGRVNSHDSSRECKHIYISLYEHDINLIMNIYDSSFMPVRTGEPHITIILQLYRRIAVLHCSWI